LFAGAWISTRGRICPITGKELQERDLVVDAALAAQLTEFHLKKALSRQRQAMHTQNISDDLYDFSNE
jgi:hypothetical protein